MQYCSDPVSLAVADVVLTVIEEELQANAKNVGDYLMERLKVLVDKHGCLGDVRQVIKLYIITCQLQNVIHIVYCIIIHTF